jgi:large subunit ribosomal protein L2
MALKQYKATSAGQRQLVNIDRSALWKGKPHKALTVGISEKSGSQQSW